MQENYEIFKDLIQTFGLLYLFNCLFLRHLKNKNLKMKKKKISENDWSFSELFFFFFPVRDPKSEKKIP